MDIRSTMNSAYAQASAFAHKVADTVTSYSKVALEKGKLGYARTVELVNHNPKAAVGTIAGVAAAVTAVAIYSLMGQSDVKV